MSDQKQTNDLSPLTSSEMMELLGQRDVLIAQFHKRCRELERIIQELTQQLYERDNKKPSVLVSKKPTFAQAAPSRPIKSMAQTTEEA